MKRALLVLAVCLLVALRARSKHEELWPLE